MSLFRRKKIRSRGQALLELALIFPALLLFCCGVLDIGTAWARNILLVSSTSQLVIAIEEDPQMIDDLDGCASYLEGYFPSNLLPEDITVTATPKTGMQSITYKYRIWGDDPASANSGEFKERDTLYRYRDYTIRVKIGCDFITPVGKVMAMVCGTRDPLLGTDYSTTNSISCRLDGALMGGSPW